MPKIFLINLLFTFFIFSCYDKLKVGEKPTNLKGWVEYEKKIKEHESGINYYPGYKEYELEKLRRKNSSPNFYNSKNESDFSLSAADKSIFTERGPQNGSGRTRAIIIDKSDPNGNTYLAASIGGGIWRGIYNPLTMKMSWSNLTPDIENLDFVSIAQSKSNPDVIYAGTGERSLSGRDNGSGLYKTNDGGATWSNISPKKIFGKGIDPTFANVYRIIIDPLDYNTLIIATQYKYYCNSYLYKSTDGGNSFSMVYDVNEDQGECNAVTQVVYAPTDFNIQYAAIKGGIVIKSTDKGSTWNQTSKFDGFQGGGFYSRNEIAVSYSDPNIIYAGIKSGGSGMPPFVLNVSYDAGENWHHIQESTKGNSEYFDDNWIGKQGNYNNFIAINPFNDRVVYVGDINIHKFTINHDTTKFSQAITDVYNQISSDGVPKKNGYVHPDQHTMTIFSDGISNFRLIVGNDGGPAISDISPDPGVDDKSWQATEFMWAWTPSGSSKPPIDAGYRTTQFYHASKVKGKNQYLGGTQDNGSYLTREPGVNGPQEATRVGSGDGFESVTHWEDPLRMMITCQFNGCAKISKDGGVNGPSSFRVSSGFKQANSEGNLFYSKLESSKQDADMIYGITSKGIIRSENFGDSWEYIKLGSNYKGGRIEVSEANPRFVYAGQTIGSIAKIHLSKDWGKTFEPINAPSDNINGNVSGIYSHPTEDSTVYLLFSYYKRAKVFESKDLGATWEDLSGYPDNFETGESSNGFPNVGVNALVVMPFDPNIIWVGTEIGLIESTDRGKSWNLVNSNLPNVMINDFEIGDQGQIVIATYGRGMWTATIPELMDFKPKESGISFNLNKDTISENEETALIQYTLTRDISPYSPMKIVFSLSGSASASDYDIIGDTMVITNSKPGSLSIKSVQDETEEGYESVKLKLSYIENGELIGSNELNLVIQDDDNSNSPPNLSFDIEKSIIAENEESFDVNIQLSKEPNQGNVEVTFDFGGTASNDDFSVSKNPLVISSGTSSTITITSVQDEIDEPDELISVMVSNIKNAGGNIGSIGVVTIIDDDEPIPLSVESDNIDFNVYPNPYNDYINIELGRSWDGEVNLSIYDMFGRVYKSKNIMNSNNNFTHRIDISDNESGILILKINKKEKVFIKKVFRK